MTVAVDLSGLKVVVDYVNGNAIRTARNLFAAFKIDAMVIHKKADGVNINNECGPTNLERLSQVVKGTEYYVGVAYDGDEDRCLAVDENGNVINGDMIIAILANDMKNNEQPRLI